MQDNDSSKCKMVALKDNYKLICPKFYDIYVDLVAYDWHCSPTRSLMHRN